MQDPTFRDAVVHNFAIVVLSLVLQGPIAILFALLLNQKFRGRSLIRVLIFVPYVISEVIVGTGWSLMMQDAGAVNSLLGKLGLGFLEHSWLADPKLAIWTLMVIITWKYIGFAVILFLAGMQCIPEELFEAAAIDGAGVLADPAEHHPAAAGTDDPDLGVPVDHRRAAALRPGLHHLGAVRRLHGGHLDDGDLHGRRTAQLAGSYGYGNAVAVMHLPDLSRRRPDLSAVRAAARHRRRADGRQRKGPQMTTDTLRTTAVVQPRDRKGVRRSPKAAMGKPWRCT